MKRLGTGIWRNDFTEAFPGDESGDLSPRQTPGALYSLTMPTPVKEPGLLAWNTSLAEQLDIAYPAEEDIAILAGNKSTVEMRPYANNYAGHQFGNWAGQLGDGRAITLGEWPVGNKTWELQLKGAGPTAYSRRADGRAVLRSSVREYLVSEAMYYLRIPTTRALGLVSTGEGVLRDMFYDGNPEYEPGAIVTRAAPSFLRFGSFEMPAAREEFDNLAKLVGWTIDRYFPEIQGEDRIIRWYREVIRRTADLMVEWQRVGFVHGVMNTDNMSILGLSIDYGPFSFLDHYDPKFTPNTTDLPGRRYAFGNQASVAYWNLAQLANALVPLFGGETQALEEALRSYENLFWNSYYIMMGKKLGFDKVDAEDKKMIAEVENMLADLQPDMTIFYRLLSDFSATGSAEEDREYFQTCFYAELSPEEATTFNGFLEKYELRMKTNSLSREDSRRMMKQVNPRFILRNYLLHQAIEELQEGKDELFKKLETELEDPYSDTAGFFERRPDWAERKAGCSMLSCSS